MKKTLIPLFLTLVILTIPVFSYERITNYASCISVNDFENSGNILYVASSGGIYLFDKTTKTGKLLPSNTSSPDPLTTALCLEEDKTLWSGTSQGYLNKRTLPANSTSISTYNSYIPSEWKILDLLIYNKYLIVASTKGISVFNTEKGFAEKNATEFGSLPSSQVNVLAIYNDTLYAGLEQGVAKLSLKKGIETVNFFDPTIWLIDTETDNPVQSFTFDSTCKAHTGFAERFNGHIVSTNESLLFLDSIQIAKLPSKITALKVVGANEYWIGTEEHYFYLWDGTSLTQCSIPGPTISLINRIYVDHTNKVWFLPNVVGGLSQWWVGIGAFENDTWKLYNQYNYPAIGQLTPDNPENSAIIETSDNRLWFGTSGGQIKTYSPETDSWKIYCVNSLSNSRFYTRDTFSDGWGKCDAFAVDSSGYLWISSWKNAGGSLICYDLRYEPDDSQSTAEAAHFKRFFSDAEYNFTSLNVDKDGRIFAGDETGKLFIFSHNGNPLRDGITILKSYSVENEGKVYDALTMGDNNTWILATSQMLVYNPETNSISTNDNFSSKIRAIAAESDQIFWVGTEGNGLIRYNTTTEETSVFTTSQGLLSNTIFDISIDKNNGAIWLATDCGISKLEIGYTLNKEAGVNDAQIFPNPYSKSRMKSIPIILQNIPENGSVSIYNNNGQFIKKLQSERKGTQGTLFTWKPAESLVPGVYFAIIKNAKKATVKRIMVTP